MFKKKAPPLFVGQSLTQLQTQAPYHQLDIKSQQIIRSISCPGQIRPIYYTQNSQFHKLQRNSSVVIQVNESDDDEDYKTLKITQTQKIKQLAEITKLANKKMSIGSGFSLDLSDFFKFKAKKELEGRGFAQLVSGGHLAWIILLYSVCNAAIIPAWIMSIEANKILRISWRFLLQALLMIPFVLYERRTGSSEVKQKYKLKSILNPQGLKRIYISSLGTSIWFTIILTCFQWTFISHSLVMGSLSNFFLSLRRSANNSTHSLQPGGQIFVIVGIIFTLADSYLLNVQQLPQHMWNVVNPYYLTRQPIQRVCADLAALSGAFIISRFSQKTADLKTFYPPFLSMFLVNISVSAHVMLSAFFLNGATFDRDTNFGVFGLFTGVHFTGFLYMAVIVSVGTLISFNLISKLFADPIIPALSMTLEPIFATFFLNLVSVQSMPGSFTIYGYIFVICGLFLILIGQFLLQKEKQGKEKEESLMKEMKQGLFNQQAIKRSEEWQVNESIKEEQIQKTWTENNKEKQKK